MTELMGGLAGKQIAEGDWARELYELLKQAERKAADGEAYGMAERLHKMAAAFEGLLKDDELADIVAEAAGVKRQPEDVCIVHVPPHWIEGLRTAVLTPSDDSRERPATILR